MAALPGIMPVTIPDKESTAATAVLLLLHVPPGTISLSVVFAPLHMVVIPVTGSSTGYTVTVVIAMQADGEEYVIVAVPADIPVTAPAPSAVATVVAPLVHAPPASESLSCVLTPAHTWVVPHIADGNGSTVYTIVAIQPVPSA